jgi:RHS repeat-associated protein
MRIKLYSYMNSGRVACDDLVLSGPQVTSYCFFNGQRIALRRDGVVQYVLGGHPRFREGRSGQHHAGAGSERGQGRRDTVSRSIPERSGVDYPYGAERWPLDGTFPTDYRFTGQKYEAQAGGLYQMGARWYDSALGRWLSPDTLVPEARNPQSLNRYTYVGNSPLRFVDPTGHKRNGRDRETDDQPPVPPDWLLELLSAPEFLEWLAAQVDSWLWDNVPSAVGIYGDVSGSLGLLAEGELNAEVSLMFNWRSGELTFLYGPGVGAYLGTPRGASISTGAGGKWTYGASRNEFLKGVDVYYGVTGGVDAFGEVEAELTGSSSLDYVDVNGNGKLDLHDDLTFFTDPNSGRHVNSRQVGLGAGVNPVPNGFEGGARAGLSVTAGFNIISGWDWKGWPWNW